MCAQPLGRVELLCKPVGCSPAGSSVHGLFQHELVGEVKGDLVFNEDRVSLLHDESVLVIGYNSELYVLLNCTLKNG